MSKHEKSAAVWANEIEQVIEKAMADGWQVGLSDDGDQYHMSIYSYDDLTAGTEVEW
jgi:hypothetical protein